MFRVAPYPQQVGRHGFSLLWFTSGPDRYRVRLQGPELIGPLHQEMRATAGQGYRHLARFADLKPDTRYPVELQGDGDTFEMAVCTAPDTLRPVRFCVYADCETEPESHGFFGHWPQGHRPEGANPEGRHAAGRRYPLDQSQGYAANLQLMAQARPDFVVIAGDLVESGGEQQDWDEFWQHNASRRGELAIPLVTALGNHEYFAGPHDGGYATAPSEAAVARWRSYFPSPAGQPQRYYRWDYGPVRLLVLDTGRCNDFLAADSPAPPLDPGSAQYGWLEAQLRACQGLPGFTFVVMHHCPYSSGPHGRASSPLSALPLRQLTPLFQHYQVSALFCGHDEMLERSEVDGLHVYDLGIGGDHLRGPVLGAENPWSRFLAHRDCPEVWKDQRLVSGGKHYGHLLVEIEPEARGWAARLTPVYGFPADSGIERRIYDDVVVLSRGDYSA